MDVCVAVEAWTVAGGRRRARLPRLPRLSDVLRYTFQVTLKASLRGSVCFMSILAFLGYAVLSALSSRKKKKNKEERLQSSVAADRFAYVSVLLNRLPSRHRHGGVLKPPSS